MCRFELRELGWKPFFERQLQAGDLAGLSRARVATDFGSHLHLLTEAGQLSVPSQLAAGCGDLAVGDWVLIESESQRIRRRFDRQTELGRKAAGTQVRHQLIAANVDTLFIVSSCNDEFKESRLERYLALALEAGAQPIVVLTKADLCADFAHYRRQSESLYPGLIVEAVDARDLKQIAGLETWCTTGKTIALVGSSGVGKSTLANSLGVTMTIDTAGIREADAKGRHTTTARSMHRVRAGGWLVDTPGMRELQLTDCEDGVADLFEEVLQLADRCRFSDCSHQGDAGCALEEAVASGVLDARRLKNYLKLRLEQARNARSLMEQRESQRKLGRKFRKIQSDKRKTRDLK